MEANHATLSLTAEHYGINEREPALSSLSPLPPNLMSISSSPRGKSPWLRVVFDGANRWGKQPLALLPNRRLSTPPLVVVMPRKVVEALLNIVPRGDHVRGQDLPLLPVQLTVIVSFWNSHSGLPPPSSNFCCANECVCVFPTFVSDFPVVFYYITSFRFFPPRFPRWKTTQVWSRKANLPFSLYVFLCLSFFPLSSWERNG